MHCPGQMACWASVELESDLILLKQKLCLQLIGPCLQQHNLRIHLPQRLEASPRRPVIAANRSQHWHALPPLLASPTAARLGCYSSAHARHPGCVATLTVPPPLPAACKRSQQSSDGLVSQPSNRSRVLSVCHSQQDVGCSLSHLCICCLAIPSAAFSWSSCASSDAACAAYSAQHRMRSHGSRITTAACTTSCHTCQLRLGSLVLVARHLKLSTKGPSHLG